MEVGERVLQSRQSDKALVVHLLVQVALGLLNERVYLLESFQVPHCCAEEQAEYHVDIVGEALIAFLLEAHEVDHHVRLIVAHGDGDVAFVNDAQGHGGIGRAAAYLPDVGNAQDDEHPSVVVLIACPFVGIADVGDEIVGNAEPLFQLLLVFVGGTCYLYPAIGLPLIEHAEPTLGVPECLHCANPFC